MYIYIKRINYPAKTLRQVIFIQAGWCKWEAYKIEDTPQEEQEEEEDNNQYMMKAMAGSIAAIN